MTRLLLIAFILSSCAEESIEPEVENSTCIYKFTVSTDAQDIGKNPYTLINCVDYPNYQSKYTVNAIDCNCPDRP